MKSFIASLCLLLLSRSVIATGVWQFDQRLAISAAPTPGVYHHLEGAGRRHIALSSDTLAVIWEDDHSSNPQVYVAFKQLSERAFSSPLPVSSGQEAYEPAIAALAANRFVLLWEQDAAVYARLLHNGQLSRAIRLSSANASHASVASNGQQAFAVWREQRDTGWSLWVSALSFDAEGQPNRASPSRLQPQDSAAALLYPSLVANDAGLTVAWEDRSHGHTRLKYSFSADNGDSFSAPQFLNEFYSNRNEYDKGSGVTRVAMDSFAGGEIISAWMDKRNGSSGYAIYAGLGGGDSFGPDEKVQSAEGDGLSHHNPAVAGNRAGDFVVAWDDYRSGDSDIWLSHYSEAGAWSQDVAPATASGAGEQTQPSIALDEQGGLHLIWVERKAAEGATQLWYSFGRKLN